jgi:hypothetical protein
MKRILILINLLVLTNLLAAQGVISSSAYIQTCIQKTNCFSTNNNSFLFYDDAKEELILKIDFTKFKTGQDSLDEWMEDLSGSNFYFVGHLNKYDVLHLGVNENRMFKINGNIVFNGVTQSTSTEVILFIANENGILSQKTLDNTFDAYRVNFGLSFLPKDFKIHKRPHHLTKIITIGVAAGRLNQLKPEMQGLIKDLQRN